VKSLPAINEYCFSFSVLFLTRAKNWTWLEVLGPRSMLEIQSIFGEGIYRKARSGTIAKGLWSRLADIYIHYVLVDQEFCFIVRHCLWECIPSYRIL